MSVMRAEYVPLDETMELTIERVKVLGDALYGAIDRAPSTPREKALAKTKLEEAVMWAVKGITGTQRSDG